MQTDALLAADPLVAYAIVVSARSGETEDLRLADVAIGWGAGLIKVGSTTRSERAATWNRLLQIKHRWGAELALAPFPGTRSAA